MENKLKKCKNKKILDLIVKEQVIKMAYSKMVLHIHGMDEVGVRFLYRSTALNLVERPDGHREGCVRSSMRPQH